MVFYGMPNCFFNRNIKFCMRLDPREAEVGSSCTAVGCSLVFQTLDQSNSLTREEK